MKSKKKSTKRKSTTKKKISSARKATAKKRSKRKATRTRETVTGTDWLAAAEDELLAQEKEMASANLPEGVEVVGLGLARQISELREEVAMLHRLILGLRAQMTGTGALDTPKAKSIGGGPSGKCSAAAIQQLKIDFRGNGNNGRIVVDMNHVFSRMRRLLICEHRYDIVKDGSGPNHPFPSRIGPNERVGLRPEINLEYFDDVDCSVSATALAPANTPAKMAAAIFAAVKPWHKRPPH